MGEVEAYAPCPVCGGWLYVGYDRCESCGVKIDIDDDTGEIKAELPHRAEATEAEPLGQAIFC